jgi:hypothetical protein
MVWRIRTLGIRFYPRGPKISAQRWIANGPLSAVMFAADAFPAQICGGFAVARTHRRPQNCHPLVHMEVTRFH